ERKKGCVQTARIPFLNQSTRPIRSAVHSAEVFVLAASLAVVGVGGDKDKSASAAKSWLIYSTSGEIFSVHRRHASCFSHPTSTSMKTLLSLAVLTLLVLPSVVYAQTGTVYDNLSMTSDILDMERKYAIYLPPDYDTSERSYPVLYLLHGGGDDQTGWVQFGEVLHIADKAIREGTATPMIIVMPDANTGRRGYFNGLRGEWRYEDFFFEE